MERIEIHTTTSGAEELAYVTATLYVDDGENLDQQVSELEGDLFRDRTLYVGSISTQPALRGQGFATRLLVHAIEVVGARTVQAHIVNGEADAVFAKARALTTDVEFDLP
ncbi:MULTISPECIES: GNAT family N-acetyltransferase [unclassified Microbacterium]|uniref:GNAT family N-acetyltransferase n=1 Tax=unclassified Microbacterium TaxID=2609290 RepID=UPI001604EDBD|nr:MULTISPECIES: GNAT family N-acetyltransferase [unclassified Microbacterium]QNA93252.1 GNAT family N-acetyltransferase [Microbacterium sp. Se63.02b]QYM63461.1 GNAT family N-acetyltransferase [Microbacterium sp. Se5.02b]